MKFYLNSNNILLLLLLLVSREWIFCFHSYFLVDRNEFDDFISSIWMNLRMQDWNDYLFLFQCLIIIWIEMKKK